MLGILAVVIWNATHPGEIGPAQDGLAQAGAAQPPQAQPPRPDSQAAPNEPARSEDTPPPAPEESGKPAADSEPEKTPPEPKESAKEAVPRPLLDGGPFAGRQAGELKRLKLDSVELVFCWCPPGKFKMGSPPGEKDRYDDETQVDVELKQGFWMLRTEVTQELYELVMNKNPSRFKLPRNPVETVSWDEAKDCATRLTGKLRQSALLPDNWGIRLPTEAQWEYACRAGPGGTGAYYFGDDETKLGQFAWYTGNSDSKVHPAGEKAPNAWGLHDMHGNVWEWCLDAYQKKLPGGVDPFVAAGGASVRVIRGGGWINNARGCRAANRNRDAPTYRSNVLGFRLAAVQSDGRVR